MKEINILNSNDISEYNVFEKKKTFFKTQNFILCVKIAKNIFLLIILLFITNIFFDLQKKIAYIMSTQKYIVFILKWKYIKDSDELSFSILEKYRKISIDWPLPKDIIFKPLMSDKELKAFLYFMKKENIYFEFGSGGSTNIASFYKLKVYSVESSIEWHQKLKDKNIIANYLTIDLKAENSGYPGNNTTLEDWKKYIQAYDAKYNADIILIDGRFRVACALDIFSKIRNDSIVLIHDYKNRKEYHIIEEFYQEIGTWDTLSAFIKRTNLNTIPQDIYNKYLTMQKI